MIERLTLEKLEAILQELPQAGNIERDEDSVQFTFRDKDKDDVTSFITLIDEERAAVMLLLAVPESHQVTAMIASNLFNNRQDVHGTFAYATMAGDNNFFMVLETHIYSRGGISEENIRQQLRTFINRINAFESVMIEGIQELGPDSSFLKGSGGTFFWKALGAFTSGFLS